VEMGDELPPSCGMLCVGDWLNTCLELCRDYRD